MHPSRWAYWPYTLHQIVLASGFYARPALLPTPVFCLHFPLEVNIGSTAGKSIAQEALQIAKSGESFRMMGGRAT